MTSSQYPASLDFAAPLVAEIDAALRQCTDYGNRCPQRLAAAIRHSLLAPGKRLRPLLVLLAAEACGSSFGNAIPAACAVEMIHAYSLIHDDLPAMDDDDLRRGRPTCHVEFDEATAILAGDALLTQAFAVLAAADWPAEIRSQCTAGLAEAAGIFGMVGGQADDLAAEEHSEGDVALLESIHSRKTGAMIRASLRLGGLVAGASTMRLNALDAYGERLGLAFQIVDDLLDFSGDQRALGKRTQKDADRGKLTFPGLLGVAAARRRAEQLIDEAIQAIAVFEESADKLQSLARYVEQRNH